ncbi:HAD hydrolase family protein [Chondromyces apiculatus]|uniref:Haloacid dehalogenase-like hydrolase n=1 Tax=Chondromyces apiculatus DSM 436 TaxID=1192034 RepID=A0A017T9T6_9BACT|nr:HAD hydrolase family protein [Chondromyces apiculatus]EYF05555.1 haloacid dehalogenase-like hydrolase [Chondromyces apiculatus DSM 436]
MKPLAQVPAELARALQGVIFDLDDTVLDHGALAEATYAALFRLREAGLRLIACTGRPAGWGEVLQRQWPLDATLVENGAIALVPASPAATRIVALDPLEPSARRARRAELLALADTLLQSVPSTALADDNSARVTDVTLDIGEHRKVPPADIDRLRHLAHQHGVRTLVSSVHLHLTHEVEDKATGALRLLSTRFGEDPTRARLRYAFIGDSGNDGAAFAAFLPTFGVANVHEHLGRMSVPPRFVAPSPMGRGFVEIALRLAALRAT